jgi:putative transcriptional regulator
MKRELFEELRQSLREANLIKRGQLKPARVFHVNPESDIVRVRGKLGLSQSKFAAILGISADQKCPAKELDKCKSDQCSWDQRPLLDSMLNRTLLSADTLQNWEQGRRSPTGPARVLLRIAARHPEVLLEVA